MWVIGAQMDNTQMIPQVNLFERTWYCEEEQKSKRNSDQVDAVGPWASSTLETIRYSDLFQDKQVCARKKQANPFKANYKIKSVSKSRLGSKQTHSLDLSTLQTQRQRKSIEAHSIIIHRPQRAAHLPIISARQEYGQIFKYTKPHDETWGSSQKMKMLLKENKKMKEKSSSKAIRKIKADIQLILKKQSPLCALYEKCIVKNKSSLQSKPIRSQFRLK